MSSYEGWPNWETWNVNLWLSNDQGLYDECIQIARENETIARTANVLDDWFHNMFLEPYEGDAPFQSGPIADWVNMSYQQVDWKEIAEYWIDRAQEIDEYEAGK